MKVRCIDNTPFTENRRVDLTLNKEYKVLGMELEDCYCVDDDNFELAYYSRDRFEIVEEDKVEQVKIKVGDKVRTKKEIIIIGVCVEFVVKRIFVDEENGDRFLVPDNTTPIQYINENDVELVPRRTVEEVLEEIRENGKPFCCENDFVVSYTKKHGWSAVTLERDIIGNCYFREDIAEAYVRELNEIIGADKK